MDINIVWTSLFDPQYAPALHLSETEKALATKFMKKELQSLIVPLMTLPPPINEAGSSTEMDVVLLSEEDDDDVFDVSFEPICTPIPTGRSSTTRKWLLVCATSTLNERVFSISGLIDTPKRSNLTGKAIFDQVLIHNNWKSLNPSLDRLRQVLN